MKNNYNCYNCRHQEACNLCEMDHVHIPTNWRPTKEYREAVKECAKKINEVGHIYPTSSEEIKEGLQKMNETSIDSFEDLENHALRNTIISERNEEEIKMGGARTENNVNHPKHYNRENSLECIDEMIEIFGLEPVLYFCLLNVWKYRYRAADKNGIEDLKKSDWYMQKYIEIKRRLAGASPARPNE